MKRIKRISSKSFPLTSFKGVVKGHPLKVGLLVVAILVVGFLGFKYFTKPASAVPWPGNFSINLDTSNQSEFLQV